MTAIQSVLPGLNIPFKDQKPTNLLFGDDRTYCFAKKSSRDHKSDKPCTFSMKFLRQSQSATPEPVPEKAEIVEYMA